MRRVGRLAVPLAAAVFLSALRATAALGGAQDLTMAAADERSIRTLVEAVFAAYTRGSHVLALWSKDAPDLPARTRELKQQLTDETATYGAPELWRLLVDGKQATLRAVIERTVAPRTGGQQRRERQIYDLTLVKGSRGWSVWRFTDATAELASALVAAAPDDRSALVDRDRELRTPALVTLVRQARAATRGGTNARALEIGRLAHDIAVDIGDDAGIAEATERRGPGARAPVRLDLFNRVQLSVRRSLVDV